MKTQHEGVTEVEGGIVLRVAGRSPANKVAGAIVKNMQEGKDVKLLAMGAGAVNQAVKAVCIARGMAAPQGWNIYTIPGFTTEQVDGAAKTAIEFTIFK